jgi:short-subunit dehydrogenase
VNLSGKNILITGSNRGIGLALAKQAAIEKMNMHLLNRTQNPDVVKELKALGAADVHSWSLDMSQPKDIEKFCEQFIKSGASPDILVNNAGQLTGGLLEEQSVDKIYQMLQVNLGGLIHLTRVLLPHMLKLKEAKIVNNASVSGLMYLPCASTYAASKAGVVAFTESIRNELEGTGVSTLLMVTPGVKTRMYDEIPDLYSKHLDLKFLNSIPAEQWVERVFQCMKDDTPVCWPSGQSYIGVKMGQHWPRLLARFVRPYFKRAH